MADPRRTRLRFPGASPLGLPPEVQENVGLAGGEDPFAVWDNYTGNPGTPGTGGAIPRAPIPPTKEDGPTKGDPFGGDLFEPLGNVAPRGTAPVPPQHTTTPPAPTPPPVPKNHPVPGGPSDFGGGDPAQQSRQLQDALGATVPLGFDMNKWRNPAHQTHKYIAGRILAAGGSVDDFLRMPQFSGWSKVGEDKIKDPNGSIFDVWYDIGGPTQRVQWTQTHGPGGQEFGPPQPPGGGGGGVDIAALLAALQGAGGGGGGQQGGQGGDGGFNDSIMQAIMGGLNQDNSANRFETVRENVERGRRAHTNQAMAALADRGLLSEPGIVQGTEIDALQRIEDTIGPAWAQALREAGIDEQNLKLGFLDRGINYQRTVGDLALGNLEQNRLWNQFLAQFGLDRETLLFEMERGNFDQVAVLFKLFLDAAGISAGGFTGTAADERRT